MIKSAKPTTIKNRSLKMSPAGIITLPVSARKALQMEKGKGTQVTVAVEKNVVSLALTSKTGGFRVSPKGQLELRGEAKAALKTGVDSHFWMELNDEAKKVMLNPFK